MCYATKRKIADCVKQLVRQKEITKITIHDIMNGTQMSRQSFYYHFKDIYDVMEWIGVHDFEQQISGEYDNMEDWVCDLMLVLDTEGCFYQKLANEMEWPTIVRCVKRNITPQIEQIMRKTKPQMFIEQPEEAQSCVEFLGIAICYYMIDYVYHRKHLSSKKVANDVKAMMRLIDGGGKCMKGDVVTAFQKAMVI